MVLARLAAVFLIASTSIAAGEIAIRSAPGKDGPSFPTTTTDNIDVVDGDTVRHRGRTVRLVGFDAPETGERSRCESERALGAKATSRLRDLVKTGPANIQLVPCACPPGMEGTPACNHGRACGVLTVGGRDVGAILIAEGLAKPFRCGATSCPKRVSWCQKEAPEGRVRIVKAPASLDLTEPAKKVPTTDGATWGLVGGVVGTILGCLGGYLGARASYRSAVNEAQRRFYRRIFAWLAPLVILFLAVVWLAAAGILPYWVYIAAMIAWLAPLPPAVFWTNRRLAQIAAEPDPRITLKTSRGAFRRDPGT
jgi:endonuclease YncB( thermonuclease family)